MNKTYVAFYLNNKEMNVSTIYFTDNYLCQKVINPATQKPFTEQEKENLVQANLTAPTNGVLAISTINEETILWFDQAGAKAIVAHADPLHIVNNQILTSNEEVVAKAISVLTKINFSMGGITTVHSACEIVDGDVLKTVKTEKILEDDTNSLILFNDVKFKNAIIEYDCMSKLLPDAPSHARGFIGVGFRVSEDTSHFEGFYVRPTNGKGCEDAYRKAHGCQYFAYPGYIWNYLREFHYEGYEAPVPTIALEEWAHIRIELIDDHAKYYVNHELVLEMQHNFFHTPVQGGFGINTHIGTDGYFKNLYIEKLD